MSEHIEKANLFFEACEGGRGWDACRAWCHADAGFSCQSAALGGVTRLEQYADWMKGMQTPMPDAGYSIKAMANDAERDSVLAFAVFTGTHTGPGGPVEPTGKATQTDYTFILQFEDGLIRKVTKVWNDGYAMQQLGWT